MSWITALFRTIGTLAKAAFSFAQERGLTDDLIQQTLGFVMSAQGQFDGNNERREWVIQQLTGLGVPDSIARLAVELAVQLMKKKAQELGV